LSGFVCILHKDNAPVERALLQHLTDFLSFRGPDARELCLDGAVGMGHTLLRTTHESKSEQQPASLDGRYWIVADARLDAREELIAELQRAERGVHSQTPDCELILHSYAAWGARCVEKLLGDFAFAIWAAQKKQLFCARDHFGVKPLYYASIGSLVVVSNTLNCIRQHPTVSGRFNDLAIAHFLLFDMIRESGATSFADIHRLSPAHILVCEGGGVSVRRYWTLPVSEPLSHSRQSDCVDEFRELLDRAVADRVRADRVGVLMSGGLDSPTVAASALRTLSRNGWNTEICAYTEVFKTLIPHEEGRYATLVAEALKIPIEFHVSDETGLWKSQDNGWPEPVHSPSSDGGLRQLREVAVRNRVVLTGFGGDPTLSCLLSAHFSKLLKNRQFRDLLVDALRYLAAQGRFSRLYLGTRIRRRFVFEKTASWYPEWLNQELEKRFGLRDQWKALLAIPAPKEEIRPTAYEALIDPFWPTLFEGYDCGATGVALEVRHPFFDLRLVNFLLALPALPWCSDKELLREAARGVLPDAVRLRRKSPLLADPLVALLQRPESAWVDSFEAVPELNRFVERKRIPNVFGEKDAWRAWIHLRPLSLNFWLRSQWAAG
jgi:asparagine synthase (glutamine-hydrolysing)